VGNSTAEGNDMKSKYKRKLRTVLIHKSMQREFSVILIALLMVATLAVAFVIHYTIRDAAFGGGYQFGKINPYEVLSQVSYIIIMRVSIILVVTLIVIAWYGVVFLHRVAGPLYRMRQTMLKLNRGENPGSIKLREGDFFHDVADEINISIGELQDDRSKLGEIRRKIDDVIQKGSGESQKSAQDIKAILES